MKIGVVGFGHFAGIVAVCLQEKGHVVGQFDYEPSLIREGQPAPADEPGYRELSTLRQSFIRGVFLAESLSDSDLLWIAYDVPLDTSGAPVVDEILARIKRLHDAVPTSIPFLVSCQWPVGTTRKIASQCEGREFVYVMENVRVGKAITDFLACPLPVLGTAKTPVHVTDNPLHPAIWKFGDTLGFLKNPLTMTWESCEFAKHSMNAFLALQIAFVNELARIAPPEVNMADVTRVLKSDPRVSPLAPLSAGGPFGGGSLKRDVRVLYELAPDTYTPIIGAILPSNEWTPDAEAARAERKARRAK